MKTITYSYECDNCGHIFNIPGVSDFNYGQFIMSSPDGKEFAYLDALNDEIFTEVSQLFEKSPMFNNISNEDRADIIQKAFTIACDTSPKGQKYHIGIKPSCPKCNSKTMKHWFPTVPESYIETDEITHCKWSNLDTGEHNKVIDQFLDRFLQK